MKPRYLTKTTAKGHDYYYFRPPQSTRMAGFVRIFAGRTIEEAMETVDVLLVMFDAGKIYTPHGFMKERPGVHRLFKRMLDSAKNRSKRRDRDFNIVLEDLIRLYIQQFGRCAVSGLPFDLVRTRGNATRRPFIPSLDRINPEIGYIPENCRLVCSIVNYAMGDWGEAALLEVAEGMIARRRKRGKRGTNYQTALPKSVQTFAPT